MKFFINVFVILICCTSGQSFAGSGECNYVSISALSEKGIRIKFRALSDNSTEVFFHLPAKRPEQIATANVVRLTGSQNELKLFDVQLYGNYFVETGTELYQFTLNSKFMETIELSLGVGDIPSSRVVYCIPLKGAFTN